MVHDAYEWVTSLPQSGSLRVDDRVTENTAGPGFAHDADGELLLIVGNLYIEVAHRETRARAMSVATRGHEADQAILEQDGLVSARIRVRDIDCHSDEPTLRLSFTVSQRRVTTDEAGAIVGDEALETSHARRIIAALPRRTRTIPSLADYHQGVAASVTT